MGVPVRTRSSHCARTRYTASGCTSCADACVHGALSLNAGPVIDRAECTGCMACVAACPTAALDAPQVMFWEIMRQLAAVPRPVLGCSAASSTGAHATVPCLAYLSEEQLAALAVLLPQGVALNMVACEQCDDRAAVGRLLQSMGCLCERMPTVRKRLAIIADQDELEFEAVCTDRRGFFSALGRMVQAQTVSILAENANHEAAEVSLSENAVPYERLVFSGLVSALQSKDEPKLLAELCSAVGFTAATSDACELCFGCVGMCPNGALDSIEGDIELEGRIAYSERLLFMADRCSGCGVCESFCTSGGIQITRGHSGVGVSEWSVICEQCTDSSAA
jgi:ferredoxin